MKSLTAKELSEGKVAVVANAEELLCEAQILIDNGKAARAFALAWEACEEIAKAPMLGTTIYRLLFGAPIDWRTLSRRFRSHSAKAHLSEEIRLRVEARKAKELYLHTAKPGQVLEVDRLFPMTSARPGTGASRADLRARSINCDFDGRKFKRPSQIIHIEEAQRAISSAREQLQHTKKLLTLPIQGVCYEVSRKASANTRSSLPGAMRQAQTVLRFRPF